MPASSNVGNYFVGKGILYWTPLAGVERELGNAPSFRLSPTTETLEHFSSQSGVRSKDREILLEKSLQVLVTLDEITPANLGLFLFGTPSTNSAGNVEFEIFSLSEQTGQMRLVGTNDVGNKFTVILPSVSVTPTGELEFITDEFGQIELTGEALLVNGSFGTIEQTDPATTL